jgi:hypothetical protein
MLGDHFPSDLKSTKDSQTPPMSDLYKTRFDEGTKVSPLEILASATKKVVGKIDSGVLGTYAREYLTEQSASYFGASAINFSEEYFAFKSDRFRFGGFDFGVAQDLATVVGSTMHFFGSDSTFAESAALMLGLKVVTQIGAYLKRYSEKEKIGFKNKKLKAFQTQLADLQIGEKK